MVGTVVGFAFLSMLIVDRAVIKAHMRFLIYIMAVIIIPVTELPAAHTGLRSLEIGALIMRHPLSRAVSTTSRVGMLVIVAFAAMIMAEARILVAMRTVVTLQKMFRMSATAC